MSVSYTREAGSGAGGTGGGDPIPATDCHWLALQLGALFDADARGRMVARRAPGLPPPPRFFLGRTRHGNLWRASAGLEPALSRRLSRLAGREPPLEGEPPWSPAEREEAIRRLLDEAAPVESVWRGPAFRFPAASPTLPGAAAVALDPGDAGQMDALRGAFPSVADTAADRAPVLLAYASGRVLAACYTAAGDPATAAEAGVETLPEHRGKGHASRVVAAWARAVEQRGGRPLYSTSWDNPGSLGVARTLALIPYAENLHWT